MSPIFKSPMSIIVLKCFCMWLNQFECSKTDPGCYGVNTFIYHVFQESQSVFSLRHSFWCTVQQIWHSGNKYSFNFGFHNAPTFLYWIDWGTVWTCSEQHSTWKLIIIKNCFYNTVNRGVVTYYYNVDERFCYGS